MSSTAKHAKFAKKTVLLNAFRANRSAILACAQSWPAGRVVEVFLGEWCLLDLLAHLSGWDDANREAVTAVQAGRLPEFYAHKDADWRGFNALHVRNHRRPTLAAQIAEGRAHFRRTDRCAGSPGGGGFLPGLWRAVQGLEGDRLPAWSRANCTTSASIWSR